jgi:hypothetical protein
VESNNFFLGHLRAAPVIAVLRGAGAEYAVRIYGRERREFVSAGGVGVGMGSGLDANELPALLERLRAARD